MRTIPFHRPDGRALQLEVIRYETSGISRQKLPDRHRHGFHSIFFILGGQSCHEVDFCDYQLGRDQLMLIPQGSIHWEKGTDSISGFIVMFTDDFFNQRQSVFLNSLLNYAQTSRKLLLDLNESQTQEIKAFMELLFQEQNATGNRNHVLVLQNLMLSLFNKVEGIVQDVPQPNLYISYRLLFQSFVSLLQTHYKTEKSVQFYTDQLKLPAKRLNEIVKEVLGKTAQDFIIEQVLLHAKRELAYSRKSIKEISYDLGYESPHYFSRIFKKKIQLSPEDFRKKATL